MFIAGRSAGHRSADHCVYLCSILGEIELLTEDRSGMMSPTGTLVTMYGMKSNLNCNNDILIDYQTVLLP